MKLRASELSKTAEAAKEKLALHRAAQNEARIRCTTLQQERDAQADARKHLWRKEQELLQAINTNAADLDKARRTLQHSMSRAQWDAVQAVKRITSEQRIKGVHGMLLELFSVDARFFTAVEVSAGNQLFQIVVDNDDIAARLMKELQKANAGRVTFMPLNRLRPGPDPAYPDSVDGLPMLKKLQFKPEFSEKTRTLLWNMSPNACIKLNSFSVCRASNGPSFPQMFGCTQLGSRLEVLQVAQP